MPGSGPLMRDRLTEWRDLLVAVFLGPALSDACARKEATVLVDAAFGLIFPPPADRDWDRAEAAFHTLPDRLEAGWRTAD